MSPLMSLPPLTLCPPALVVLDKSPPCVNSLGKTLDLSISSKVDELCQIREIVFWRQIKSGLINNGCIKPSQSDELLYCHLSLFSIWCIHGNHMTLLMFQSAKSQKISRNTNVHNSDALNTVFKSECRSSSLSLFPWNLLFEHTAWLKFNQYCQHTFLRLSATPCCSCISSDNP